MYHATTRRYVVSILEASLNNLQEKTLRFIVVSAYLGPCWQYEAGIAQSV
jgi:hypothetical protein